MSYSFSLAGTQTKFTIDERFSSTVEKIVDVEQLPTWKEAREFYLYMKQQRWGGLWLDFCFETHIFQILSTEFVEALAKEICDLEIHTPVLEVGAGNGKLSYWLNQYGVETTCTDDYSFADLIRPSFVQKMDYREALSKNFELVISSWTGPPSLPHDVIEHPAVRYFVDVGEGEGDACASDAFWQRKDILFTSIKSVDRYSLSRSTVSLALNDRMSYATLCQKKS